MKRETIAMFTLILIIFVFSIAICLVPNTTTLLVEKVRVDSIYSKPRYENLPELMWVYDTKLGSITTNNSQIYEVGDSIEIRIIKNENNEKDN